MKQMSQQESFRCWGYALAAGASVLAALTCFAGRHRTEKNRVRRVSGLVWLAGAAGWALCLFREFRNSKPTIKP